MASIWPCFCLLRWQTAQAFAAQWKGQSFLEEPLLLLCLTGWVGPRVRACLFLKGGGVLLVLCFGVYLFFHGCWDKVPQTFDFKQKLEPGEVTQDSCLKTGSKQLKNLWKFQASQEYRMSSRLAWATEFRHENPKAMSKVDFFFFFLTLHKQQG